MTDQTQSIDTQPPGGAAFNGQTPRKGAAIRAGAFLGTGLLVAIGAAVALGASPTPSGSNNGGQTQTDPGTGAGDPFGELGGPGLLGGPGDPVGPGNEMGRGGPGDNKAGRGHGPISVTAISGSNVSLATEDGWSRTIAVTSATTITRGGATATLADIAVGDIVRFGQTRNSDGTYTITALAVVLPRAAGTVTAVGADTITITAKDGTSQTIATTAATTYRLGRTDGSRADVTVGSTIVAIGERSAAGTITATTVAVRLPHAIGTATTVTGDTITISRRDGTSLTIHVGSGTTIEVVGVASATLADVKTGMVVAVAGTQRTDGSFDATEIHAGQPGLKRGHDGFGPGTKPAASAVPDGSTGSDG